MTHDRYFLDNAAEWILELDRGRGIPWKGNYSSWLDQKQARLAQEEASESARQKALKRELEWVRAGTKGQQTKSKSRIARFEELSTYEYQRRNETSEIFIPVADRLGAQVIEFSGVRKAYGDRLLMDEVNFSIPPGAIVGIIGPNGAGKSTLFRMIVGEESADDGDISVPKKITIGYFRQEIEEMSGRSVLDEAIAGSGRLGDLHHELETLQNALTDASRAAISRSRSARSLAANGGACISPRRCSKAETSCCWTSRRTTSTSKRFARSRTRWASSPEPSWSSATTDGFSTGSRRISSHSKATAAWRSSRATTTSTKPTK